MSALVKAAFAKANAENRPAFIPYVTAAFPDADSTVPMLLALQEGGADVIELGMPFSDPMADGPTIQRSSFIGLSNGVTTKSCLESVVEARKRGLTVPVILMTYYNIFSAYGEAKMVKDCAETYGIQGFIVVDLPLEEAAVFSEACKTHDLCFVPLVAPTSQDDRLATIAAHSSGYVYCVSVTGTTGARKGKALRLLHIESAHARSHTHTHATQQTCNTSTLSQKRYLIIHDHTYIHT